MRWRTILFDLDGTLIDSAKDIAASANAAREGLGYPRLEVETVRGLIGDGVDVLMRRCVRPDDVARGVEIYRAHHAEHLLDTTRAYPGIDALLADLARAGAALAVVSNKPLRFTQRILEALSLARFFGVVIGGDGPAGRKPAPGPFEAALLALGAPPREGALVVGDGRNDVLGARAAGLEVCGVLYGIGAPDEMRELGPDLIAVSVADLRRILIE
jgi:phosphoglycolate phosphatase